MRDEEDGGKVLASCDTCNGAGDVSEECTENLEDLHRKTTGYVFGMFFALIKWFSSLDSKTSTDKQTELTRH